MSLWNYLREQMLQHPFQTLYENEAAMTYEDVVVFVEDFAGNLKGEKCCAILCGSEMMAAISLLSCFAAGVTAVPLSVRYGELHCNNILDFIHPSCVITDMSGKLQVLHFNDNKYNEPSKIPALIMCTSGTTGSPKGVMLSEKNILTNVKDVAEYFKISTTDTILISRPLYHCAVLTGEFLTALWKGSCVRFFSERFNPQKIWSIIAEKAITVFCGTPTLLDIMAFFLHGADTSMLRHIVISGECMEKSVGERIQKTFRTAAIYHVYGLTEACPRVSYLPPSLFNTYPDYVGIPLRSVSIKILKKDGQQAMLGEEGILWIKGNNIMLGYYNNPIQTQKALKNGWLCTGDIAVLNKLGLLKIKGRSDNLIIRAGMNIYPQEIESALKTDSRVKEVLVYGVQNSKLGTQIGMKIAGNFSSSEEVKQLCIECLPAFQVPTYIELVDELPKSAFFKRKAELDQHVHSHTKDL